MFFFFSFGVSFATSNINMVALGDSNTFGVNLSASQRYTNKLATDAGITITNVGVNWYQTTDLINQVSTLSSYFVSGKRNVATVLIWTNDFNAGASVSTTWTNLNTLIANLKTAGWEVWVITYPPKKNDSTRDALISSYNSLILSWSGYTPIPVYSDFLSGSIDTKNGLMQSDGLHMSEVWHSIVYLALRNFVYWVSTLHNFAIWSPTDKDTPIQLLNNGLTILNSPNGAGWSSIRSNISKTSGKWYWEYKILASDTILTGIGKISANLANFVWSDTSGWGYYSNNGKKANWAWLLTYGASSSTGDIIGVAMDIDNWTVTFYKNVASQGVAFTSIGSPQYAMASVLDVGVVSLTANFWQTPFAYAVPSGYSTGIYNIAPSCTNTLPSCNGVSCSLTVWTPTIESQSWVLNGSTCGFSCTNWYTGAFCQLPPAVPITGYFSTPATVSSGSYTWNMTINLSASGHVDDLASIQLWNYFKIVSAVPSGNTIVLTVSPFSGALASPCSVYTVNIPWWLIQGNDWVSTNPSAILWSFEVVGCPWYSGSTNTGSTNTGWLVNATLSQSGTYIPLFAYRNGEILLNYQGSRNAILFFILFFGTLILIFKLTKWKNTIR